MTPPQSPIGLSSCCGAPVTTQCGEDFGKDDEVATCWNECSACHNPCGVRESAPALWELSRQPKTKEFPPIEEDKAFPKLLQALAKEDSGAPIGLKVRELMEERENIVHGELKADAERARQFGGHLCDAFPSIAQAFLDNEERLKDMEQEKITIMEEHTAIEKRYLKETKKRDEALRKAEDALEWIEELANSASYGKGGDSPETRLRKIRETALEVISPQAKEETDGFKEPTLTEAIEYVLDICEKHEGTRDIREFDIIRSLQERCQKAEEKLRIAVEHIRECVKEAETSTEEKWHNDVLARISPPAS